MLTAECNGRQKDRERKREAERQSLYQTIVECYCDVCDAKLSFSLIDIKLYQDKSFGVRCPCCRVQHISKPLPVSGQVF